MGFLSVCLDLERAELSGTVDKNGIENLSDLRDRLKNIKAQDIHVLNGKIHLKPTSSLYQKYGGIIDTNIKGYSIGDTRYTNCNDLGSPIGIGYHGEIYIIIETIGGYETRVSIHDIERITNYSISESLLLANTVINDIRYRLDNRELLPGGIISAQSTLIRMYESEAVEGGMQS